MSAPPLVLASGSPRRREILSRLCIPFVVRPAQVRETPRPGERPDACAARLAADKALSVIADLEREGVPDAPFVLAADTVVVVDGEQLGKPADDADARAMIARLAGRAHDVTTAVALGRAGEGLRGERVVTTEVCFRELSRQEIEGYVGSGEGRDKAGAYAVQGLGAGLVRSVRGCYHNVVGLPAVETLLLLREAGALQRWP